MSTETIPPRFGIGDTVRVKSLSPEGHMRTPWYIRGKVGVIGGQVEIDNRIFGGRCRIVR